MFAGIGIASEHHVLARLDARGVPIGKPVPFTEDREGHDTLLRLLGPPPVLVAMEATGHHWKNLYAALVATGHHVALLNPLRTRRFQDSALERTKTDAIDAAGIARFAFEKRPEPTVLSTFAPDVTTRCGRRGRPMRPAGW
jgi:transposase